MEEKEAEKSSNPAPLHVKCLETTKEWCETTSFHGLPNIARSTNIFFTVLWVVCLCGSSGYCTYSLYTTIVSFLEFNVVTQIQKVYENPTDFPAITICNINPFVSYTGLGYVNETLFKNGVTNVTDPNLLKEFIPYDYQAVLNTYFFKGLVLSNAKNEPDSTKSTFGVPLRSLVVMCFYNRQACDDTSFSWYYSPEFGNCYQFNPNSTGAITTSKPGSKYGLSMALAAANFHTPYSLSFNVGNHVFINNQTFSPHSSNGLEVSPGTSTNIAISRTFSQQLPKPYNECYEDLTTPDKFDSFFYRETLKSGYAYRQVDCLNLVEQDYYIKNCSCAEANYPTLYGAKYCETIPEYFCIYQRYLEIYSMGKNKDWVVYCPLECSTQEFTYTTSFSKFPSESLSDILLEHPYIQMGIAYIGKSYTIETLQDSFAYVNIFYDYTGYTLITETPSQEAVDLLGSLGGTMGLYIGVSFLSFVEVAELIIKLFILAFKNLSSNQRKVFVST